MTTFARGAEAYEHYMGRWSERLVAPFASAAGIEAGARALDVGCGPGALTAELVARLGAAMVSAVEPNPGFLAAARAHQPDVDIREALADDLPFEDNEFDAALAQLVVHFMPDPVAGLREMARVTRSGGVVAACVWDYPGGRGPLGPFWDAARALDPAVEDESGLPGVRDGHLVALLAAAGLIDVVQSEITVSREYPTFEAWWQPFTLGMGPGGVYVAGLDEGRTVALRERCRSLLPGGPFALEATAWAARGVVR
ncbi:MAG: class I SAM-dependent methyltransferase [Dehalococcoidia bacterium]|nr:class I SAM-dependent methyltransferase [Dehalococcoidia bacterium]